MAKTIWEADSIMSKRQKAWVRFYGSGEKIIKNTAIILDPDATSFHKGVAVENLVKATLDLAQAAPVLLPDQFKAKEPEIIGYFGQKLNAFHFGVQLTKFADAVTSGDSDRIVSESLGFASSTASVLSILPSPIAPFMRAASLGLTLLKDGWDNKTAILNTANALQAYVLQSIQEMGADEPALKATYPDLFGASANAKTTRLNDTWVATDLGNGSRLLNWSPIDKSTPGEMVILETNGPKQKLEIPDGKGGYLQIAMSDKTTDVTSWAGVPGQSVQLKRVLTTQTDTGQNSKTYQGTALVKESTTSEQTINGQASQVIDTVYYDKGQVTSQETVTLTGTMTVTQSYGPKGQLISRTEVQTYDDGSRFEYKTEGGKNYIQAIDEDGKASGWREYKPPAQEQATNAMYSDMAGFVNALRGKDKVNQLLYAAKIGINYQISQGSTQLALGAQVIKGLVSCANDNSWRKTA